MTITPFELSELPSILEEDGIVNDPVRTAKAFLQQVRPVTPIKLSEVAKQFGLSTESLILKLAETDFELFIICPNWELEVDELIEESEDFFTRAEYEDFLYRTTKDFKSLPAPAIRFPHDGYLRLTSSHLRGLGKSFSIKVDQFWTNPQLTEYISFSSPQEISQTDICLDEKRLPELSSIVRKKPAPIATRKPRSDKDDSLYAVIAGLTYLLIQSDKAYLHPSKEINKSKIAECIVASLEEGDDAVKSKTAQAKIRTALDAHKPAL